VQYPIPTACVSNRAAAAGAMEADGNDTPTTEVKDGRTTTVVHDYSPTRSYGALALFLVDNLLSAVVIGPLVVCYWRGTWELLDVFLFPDDKAASGWTCTAVGNVGLLCLVYAQKPLARWIHADRTLHWVLGYHAYTYVLGALNVCHWRGVWLLLDHYTGVSVLSSWTTFAIGSCLLCCCCTVKVKLRYIIVRSKA